MSEILSLLSTIRAGAFLPALQSVITGLIVALVAFAFSGRGELALLSGAVVAGLAWLVLLFHWIGERRAVFYALAPEPVVFRAPEPEPAREPLVVHVHEGNDTKILVLNVEPEKLRALARGVEQGYPLSESAWCGSGKPFSLSQFRELRAQLLARGLLRWRNEESSEQGVELAPGGRAFIRYCASSPTLPERAREW